MLVKMLNTSYFIEKIIINQGILDSDLFEGIWEILGGIGSFRKVLRFRKIFMSTSEILILISNHYLISPPHEPLLIQTLTGFLPNFLFHGIFLRFPMFFDPLNRYLMIPKPKSDQKKRYGQNLTKNAVFSRLS